MNPRIIKKYANRKLYDVFDSRYVNMDELLRIAEKDHVQIIEHTPAPDGSAVDITASTLLQALARHPYADRHLSQDILGPIIGRVLAPLPG